VLSTASIGRLVIEATSTAGAAIGRLAYVRAALSVSVVLEALDRSAGLGTRSS
jgi:hypothetical protein